jgi:preprotein translocase subunit SecD
LKGRSVENHVGERAVNRSFVFLQNSILAGALLICPAGAAELEAIFLNVQSASAINNAQRRPAIIIRLDPESGRAFAAFSSRHVGEYLEVRLSDEILTRPRLQTPITIGMIQIDGGADDAAAEILVQRLSALGAKIEIRAAGPP